MESITPNKFLKELNENLEIVDKIITGDLIISGQQINQFLTIEECFFEGKVSLTDTNFAKRLTFKNCNFKNDFSIHKVTFKEQVIFEDNTFRADIIIADCSISSLVFKSGKFNQIIFEGVINAVTNSKSIISFEDGSYNQLIFSSKELNCPIALKGGSFDQISFEKNKLNNRLLIDGENIKIDEFHIISSDFFDRTDFFTGYIDGTLYVHKANFHEQIVLRKEFNTKSLSLNYIVTKQNFGINYDGNIKHLTIANCDFTNGFNCDYYSTEPKSGIEELSCTINGIIKGSLIFENIFIHYIDISGVNLGNIIFKKIKNNFIIIKDFYNQNKLTFADIKLLSGYNVLIIFDSNINNTEFVNVDFRKFKELVIAKSEVSNIVLSNSVFPSKIQIGTKNPRFGYEIHPDEKINDNTYYRETYRQLKVSAEKQGNRALSLVFRAKEMHYLRKELSWGWDKAVLYLNYISNNHGLSWSRGILFTVIVSWLLFILYQDSLNHPTFYWALHSSSKDIKYAFRGGLHEFSNFWASFPLFKSLENDSITWKTNLVFILSRIFMGYGIYQTITAFRKFVNK